MCFWRTENIWRFHIEFERKWTAAGGDLQQSFYVVLFELLWFTGRTAEGRKAVELAPARAVQLRKLVALRRERNSRLLNYVLWDQMSKPNSAL